MRGGRYRLDLPSDVGEVAPPGHGPRLELPLERVIGKVAAFRDELIAEVLTTAGADRMPTSARLIRGHGLIVAAYRRG